jgi:ESF2/ABP1 family protein
MSDDDESVATASKPAAVTDEKRSGVIYLQTIPPLFTVRRIRETFEQFGDIGRIYLQAEKRRLKDGKKLKKFSEGWVEFADKKLAKRVAASLNNTPVGGRRRSLARESLWSMKYLNG